MHPWFLFFLRPLQNVKGHVRFRVPQREEHPPRVAFPGILEVIGGEARQRGGLHQCIEGKLVRLHQKAGRRHLLAAERVPEAKFRAQQEIEAVDLGKAQAFAADQLVAGRHADKELFVHEFLHCGAVFRLRPEREHRHVAPALPPCGEHFLVLAQLPEPDPEQPVVTDDGSGDIVAGVVIGGIAAVGAYEVGTGLYRITQMDDVAMPTNRLALAKLLWERAGKPEPENLTDETLYSDMDAEDTDAQKAARWAVEQELLNDDDSVEGERKFHPAFPVSKLRVCLTWEKAKQKGLFDQNTEA